MTPTGSPLWTRTADITQYGGHPYKANYQSQGVVNPRTDVGAEGFARLTADVAAIARVQPFATIAYQCNDTATGAPTVLYALMQTGITFASYAGNDPPAGFPAAGRNGNGDVTFTFGTTYTDDYGVVAGFGVTHVIAGLNGSGATVIVPQWTPTSTAVRLRALSATTGAAVLDASGCFMVW